MFGLKSASLFGDTKKLEREIDEFVDIVSEVGLVFKSIVPTYLNHSANGKFEEMVEKVKDMESKADKITCLLYTSPSPRDGLLSRMPSSA